VQQNGIVAESYLAVPGQSYPVIFFNGHDGGGVKHLNNPLFLKRILGFREFQLPLKLRNRYPRSVALLRPPPGRAGIGGGSAIGSIRSAKYKYPDRTGLRKSLLTDPP